jgi:hypothetical protein
MRNFSTIAQKVFQSASVNYGEHWIGDPGIVLSLVVKEVASAMEVTLHDFNSAYLHFALKGEMETYDGDLTPSEVRCVLELYDFHNMVVAEWCKIPNLSGRPLDEFSRAFIYTNMNEGLTVVWTVHLERGR